MNRRTHAIEKAMKRLAEAREAVRKDEQFSDMVQMLADKMDENQLTILIDLEDASLVFVTLRHVQNLH